MQINEKLKELRMAQKMTQEDVAEYLGVSAQSVSKWERGILSPDINLLPKLAVLYNTSIDSIFNMEFYWDEQHKSDFKHKIKELLQSGGNESVYNAYITEIELMPDRFEYYPDVMLLVLRRQMFDDTHIGRLIRLADYADARCANDDIRNEIHRLMLQICSFSDNAEYKNRVKSYYGKLSMLRHSREVYSKFVLQGEQYKKQLQANIMYSVDIAECAIRQMAGSEMPPEEKLFYYLKAASLYEAVLDGKFAGFYDIPLLCDYIEIAKLYVTIGQKENANGYICKIFDMLEKFGDTEKQAEVSVFVPATYLEAHTPPEKNCVKLLQEMLADGAFEEHRTRLLEMLKRFT